MSSDTLPRQGRRRFRGTRKAAHGAAVVGPKATAYTADAEDSRARCDTRSDRFGRLFSLPPFAEPTSAVAQALFDMGRPGGMLDANDELSAGPAALLTDPSLSLNNPDNPTQPAGMTFFGQFLEHDMTFHAGPRADPIDSRAPAFDLATVYGDGPVGSRQLYDQQDRGKLCVENGGLFEDVPRDASQKAIIGDARNDANLIVSGLHAAFLFAHNRALDMVRQRGRSRDDGDGFLEAQRLLRWHYQWLIVHEFLPLCVGQPMVDDILRRGRRFFTPPRASMPVDFLAAANRFGLSTLRPSYRANLAGDAGRPFFGFISDPSPAGGADPADLTGGARAPRRFVGWQSFFDCGDGQVTYAKRINTHLSTPLFRVPPDALASHTPPAAQPQRVLLKHLTWSLPSGQAIARSMRAPVLSASDLDELARYQLGFEHATPLFYYVLKEAQLVENGLRLGPVGGRIVAEVILGLLQLNADAYLACEPGWRPTLPSRAGRGDFRLLDLLIFAGVDPASRGQ